MAGEREKVERALFKQEGDVLVHQVLSLQSGKTSYWQEVKTAQQKGTDVQNYLRNSNPDIKTAEGMVLFGGLIFLPSKLRKQYILQQHETPLNGHARPEIVLSQL
jgi:hypothetical protein